MDMELQERDARFATSDYLQTPYYHPRGILNVDADPYELKAACMEP